MPLGGGGGSHGTPDIDDRRARAAAFMGVRVCIVSLFGDIVVRFTVVARAAPAAGDLHPCQPSAGRAMVRDLEGISSRLRAQRSLAAGRGSAGAFLARGRLTGVPCVPASGLRVHVISGRR